MQMQSLEKFVVNGPIWSWLLRRRYLPQLLRLADTTAVGRALELGCGQGTTTEEILKRFPHLHLTALDYDPDQMARAHKRLARFFDRVSIQQGDATALDFSDDHFDAVFTFNLFHHIRDYRRALAETARVLRPNGKLYVTDLDRRFFNPLFKKLFPPEVLFSREEFLQSLESAGFQPQRVDSRRRVFFVQASKLHASVPKGVHPQIL